MIPKQLYLRHALISFTVEHLQVTSENSKLRTYGIFKSEVREEPYLRIVKNVKDRISMSKFRLSNHKLMIEKG